MISESTKDAIKSVIYAVILLVLTTLTIPEPRIFPPSQEQTLSLKDSPRLCRSPSGETRNCRGTLTVAADVGQR